MADPTPAPRSDPADEGPVEEPAPRNRAERRAKAGKPATTGRTGPQPDPTLRRGRGPRSHTKRV